MLNFAAVQLAVLASARILLSIYAPIQAAVDTANDIIRPLCEDVGRRVTSQRAAWELSAIRLTWSSNSS